MAEATLEAQLEELLDQETFSPPSEFAQHAVISDPAIHEQAANDPEGFWAKQAERISWAIETMSKVSGARYSKSPRRSFATASATAEASDSSSRNCRPSETALRASTTSRSTGTSRSVW
mgnify:CR=1 FL=1